MYSLCLKLVLVNAICVGQFLILVCGHIYLRGRKYTDLEIGSAFIGG